MTEKSNGTKIPQLKATKGGKHEDSKNEVVEPKPDACISHDEVVADDEVKHEDEVLTDDGTGKPIDLNQALQQETMTALTTVFEKLGISNKKSMIVIHVEGLNNVVAGNVPLIDMVATLEEVKFNVMFNSMINNMPQKQ